MFENYYNVKNYGAIGDGIANDTPAVQKTIDQCHRGGGGYVLLSRGIFCCGAIYLKSNVYLKIDVSAKLIAHPDISLYGDDTHYNRYVNEEDMDRCFIYAEDASNIGIIGEGEINGNAEAFPNEGSIYRPMMVRFLRCKHIHVRGLRLYNSAAWTTAFLDSEDIWVENLDIYNDKRYNGDGLNFDGSRNIFINNCKINGTDDNLCLQSSSKDYPVRNVHITNCKFTSICAGIRIGLKSIGEISNVVIQNCSFENVWREGIKIECTEGGSITDIIAKGIVMRNVTRPIFIILNNRLERIGSSIGLTTMPEIGELKRIHINDLIATDDQEMNNVHRRFNNDIMGCPSFNGIRVDAAKNYPIQDLTLRNITYTTIGGVMKEEIPEEYPEVVDMRYPSTGKVSENYYPDWSRATFMDIRNVNRLSLEGIRLHSIKEDTRTSYIIENCETLAKDITEY